MANSLTMTSVTAANRTINNTYYTMIDVISGNPAGVIYASNGNFTYDNQASGGSHYMVCYDTSNPTPQNFVIRANFNGVEIASPKAATSATPIFTIKNTNAPNQLFAFLPETAAGSYNPITATGTSLMYSSNANSPDTTSITIAPHSNTSCGLVLDPSSCLLGCGGGGNPPTNRIDIDGSANTIALTSVNPPTSTTSVAIPFPDSSTKLATTAWVSTNFNSGSPSYNIIVIQDDFLTGLVSIVTWVSTIVSGGTGAVQTSIPNHPGLYRIGIPVTANSSSAITLNQSPITMTQLNYVEWIWRYNTNYTLRTIQVGVANSTTVFTTSAYWELTSTNSYEAWFNGVFTGFTVSATNLTGNLQDKWLYGKIEILSPTSIKYTLTNLTDNVTETYTHTGTVSANLVTPICKITQTATVFFGSADLDIDYCAFKYTTTRT